MIFSQISTFPRSSFNLPSLSRPLGTTLSRGLLGGALLGAGLILSQLFAQPVQAQTNKKSPLRLEIINGVVEPISFAIGYFGPENKQAAPFAAQIAQLITADLTGSGLLRRVPKSSFISEINKFGTVIQYADWRAINAQALITGSVRMSSDGKLTVKFLLHDSFAGKQIGDGLQLTGSKNNWRRLAHKLADQAYARLTGETPYFDSRIVFIAEDGPKKKRRKRLAIMDYDGAGRRYLSDGGALVLAPRISPKGDRILYTSYESGVSRIYLMDIASKRYKALDKQDGVMTFAPRFSPTGTQVLYALSRKGNTDIYLLDLTNGKRKRLTTTASIETAPGFSPNGRHIVFESDRSGSPQLYVMPVAGGRAERISRGKGRYGTPVWSPRGDMIAFTKQYRNRFHIGVMRIDGSEERLLTGSFLDEGPTWSPNGRVLMFFRETAGARGKTSIYSVDVSGRNLKKIETGGSASDPAWSPAL